MKIITIGNIKGGVGKTTTVLNVASELARQGYKTLIIDGDSQSDTTNILDIGEFDTGLYEVYKDKHTGFDDAIYEVKENLYIVPNNIRSNKLEMELATRMNRESILKAKLETMPDLFDFCIVDTSPFLGLTTQNCLAIADYYICVLDNSSSALSGFSLMREVVQELKDVGINKDLKLLGVLRNRFDKRTNYSKSFNSVLEEAIPEHLFKVIIPDAVKYKEAAAMHQAIQGYSMPHAKVYTDLVDEIKERIE